METKKQKTYWVNVEFDNEVRRELSELADSLFDSDIKVCGRAVSRLAIVQAALWDFLNKPTDKQIGILREYAREATNADLRESV